GNFNIKYYRGKFNAYQRTYVFSSFENFDLKFIFYSLKLCLENFKRISQGTATKFLTAKILNAFEVSIPNLETQKKISSVLSAIDDKIEINDRINKNLEEQAQAIYHDFISAHHDGERTGILSELITVKYGKDHKKLNDGNFPVYGSGGIIRYAEKFLYSKESVLIPRKGSLNNVMYVDEPFWSVDTMFFTEMKISNIAKYVFHFLKDKNLALLNTGSAVPSMTTDILDSMIIKIPTPEQLNNFENIISPLYKIIKHNLKQIKNLSALRDALLPELMDGRIDVSEISD
ncbi:MAG: restriction endonuclease subunit S, partial [Muribaculaceae bacterium]|nr:restriction endonuclease subunit S [Muribaculaceae bacterium]